MTKTLQAAAQAPEITDAMVDAYLAANTAYWAEVDAKPWKPGVWRNGTPREATRVSLAAALASVSDALAAIAAARQERVPDDADAQSKAMLVARLEAMSRSGDTWLTIPSVLALINDCDMLAARAAPKPDTPAEPLSTPRFDHNWLTGQPASTPEEIEAWRRQQLQGPPLDWSGT